MKKIVLLMVLGLLAMIAYAGPTARAQEKKEKPAAAATTSRWHGTVIRFSSDHTSLDVKKGASEKKVYVDSSTKWTAGKKTIEMSEVKEGSEVICLGTLDQNGNIHATRIDLRH